MTDHLAKTVLSYEAALGAHIPRTHAEAPDGRSAFFMLFNSTLDSLLTLSTPLSRYLEAGLIIRKLEEAGPVGAQVLTDLHSATETASTLSDHLLQILGNLLELMLGAPVPTVSKAEVLATGLYPGDTPPDFDITDYL
jgi:hypothetical protein